MRYFDEYEKLIKSRAIPACAELKLAIKRIKRYKRQYEFKQEQADRRIEFIERECSNTKGQSGRLRLALPQKIWLETVWGFYRDLKVTKTDPVTMKSYAEIEKRRLINEVALVVSRGTGKTTLAAAVGLVGQIIDGEYGADVQILAYNREQSGYAYNASRAMPNAEGTILNLMRENDVLRSTKRGMEYVPTNSVMTIKTSDYDSLDGTNAHYNIFDEVHTYDDDFIKVVNDGSSKKRKNWITWYITTNGTKRDKVFDRYYNIWIDVLNGKIDNDSIMPFIYKLDDAKEIHKPKMWMKAIPLLGVTTEPETIAREIEMCKDDPVAQAELMAKTFNIPINNYLAFFTNKECAGNAKQFDVELFRGNDERNARCIVGIDLSDVNDICAISFMTIDGDRRYFLNKKYMPRSRIEQLPKSQRDKYLEWEAQGHLHIHELDNNDQEYVYNDLAKFMAENKIMPVAVGYDKWNAAEMKRYFEADWGDVCHRVEQNTRTLSNPLKVYKAKTKAGKIIFDDPVSTWNHANVNVKIDANGNIYPNKAKAKDKIDVFMAQLDAFVCYEANKEDLAYYFD
jgi:phage terminase large subunit-like protein